MANVNRAIGRPPQRAGRRVWQSEPVGGFTPTAEVNARRFDDVDDYIQTSIGGANVTTNLTFAALVRSNASGEFSPIFGQHDAADTTSTRSGLEISLGNALQIRTNNTASVAPTITIVPADGWVLAVVTKAAGSTFPRFHAYKAGAWAHEDYSLVPRADLNTAAGGKVEFGRLGTSATLGDLDLAVAGVWSSVLSDADIETLVANWATQDWADLSPQALWDFGQASTATNVTDLTSGGADQSAIVGTTVITTGPAVSSLAWTYGVTAAPLTQSVDDPAAATDDQAKAVGKLVADPAAATDANAKAVARTSADPAAATDATAKAVGHPVADPAAATDAQAKAVGKRQDDAAAATDATSRVWAAKPTIADPAAATDAQAKAVTKGISDAAAATDSCSPVLGVGGVDRTKNLDDVAAATDAQAKAVTRLSADPAAATDATAHAWVALRTISDPAAATDLASTSGSGGQTISDPAAATDATSKAVGAKQAEAPAATDARTVSPGKKQADAGAATDANAKAITKVIADAAASTDNVTSGGSGAKAIGDAAAATDAISFVWVARRTIADPAAATDVPSRKPGLIRADVAAAVDARARAIGVHADDPALVTDQTSTVAPVTRALADIATATDACFPELSHAAWQPSTGEVWDQDTDTRWPETVGAGWGGSSSDRWPQDYDTDWS